MSEPIFLRFSFLGLKVAATASAINSLLKAKKRRNRGDSCTYSFNKHITSDHTLPDTVVGTERVSVNDGDYILVGKAVNLKK